MLRIDGKDYQLKYPINVLCSMCDAGIDIKTVRELFMYGLKHENKKITQNQAGDLMDAFFEDGGDFNELVDEIMNCLNKSLGGKPVEEEKEEEEGK